MIQKEHMTDKTKKSIYDAIDYSFINASLLHPTYNNRYKKDSKNSYIISRTKKENQPETSNDDEKHCLLQDVFKIGTDDREAFKKAFEMAVRGDGQEGKRITVMHSSSLCALLCFYKVDEHHPIRIRDIEYDKVFFEVQNEVFDNPSNIDVVLVSSKGKSILFLESKFSEYLSHGKCSKISNKYTKEYEDLNLKDLGYSVDEKGVHLELSRKNGNNNYYVEGIKQMISHYIGVRNFCNNSNKKDTKNEVTKYLCKSYKVELGEILFNAWLEDASFCRYSEAYTALAKRMNEKASKFRVIENVLTYQTVFSDSSLDARVKEYYKL